MQCSRCREEIIEDKALCGSCINSEDISKVLRITHILMNGRDKTDNEIMINVRYSLNMINIILTDKALLEIITIYKEKYQ